MTPYILTTTGYRFLEAETKRVPLLVHNDGVLCESVQFIEQLTPMQEGLRLFTGLGARLDVHPSQEVLTQRGGVKVDCLSKGDYLVSCCTELETNDCLGLDAIDQGCACFMHNLYPQVHWPFEIYALPLWQKYYIFANCLKHVQCSHYLHPTVTLTNYEQAKSICMLGQLCGFVMHKWLAAPHLWRVSIKNLSVDEFHAQCVMIRKDHAWRKGSLSMAKEYFPSLHDFIYDKVVAVEEIYSQLEVPVFKDSKIFVIQDGFVTRWS